MRSSGSPSGWSVHFSSLDVTRIGHLPYDRFGVRVVIVSANFRPHVGGIERFAENLATGLGERGHSVEVVCCRAGDAPRRERTRLYSITRVPSSYVLDRRLNVPWPIPSPALLGKLHGAVRDADVVHVQDAIYPTSAPALLLARRSGVASVLTQHVAFVPQRSSALDAAQHAAHATLGRCARLADVVSTYNPAVGEWMRARWGIRDPRVLPVGVPDTKPATDRAELRRSFGLPVDRFVAVFVGRDVPKKGLRIFLDASDPAFELVAVTDRAGPAANALILPFMPSERLQQLLDCADSFVLPSEAEGFPLSLQEALAKGLPVVTTWQPGYEQYLEPDDAFLVERDPDSVRNALRQLAADDALRAELAERSRAAAARHFGVERFVSAYEAAYADARALVAARRQGPSASTQSR
jgi:glycosyltransferase involved in cell wall biosynthesis